MKRNMIFALAMAAFATASAQSVTYNHDASKKGQIEVMEIGAGTLNPDYYYSLLHSKYKDEAKQRTSVKNDLRTAANVGSLPQVEYSDSIQGDLESRAKVEAINIADRELDLAWLTEGSKIESRLLAFRNNINSLVGRTGMEEIDSWRELADTYAFAIKATQKAYMPNSERHKQYLAIYESLTASNDELIVRVRLLATKNQANKLVTAMSGFKHRVKQNADASFTKWRDKTIEGSTNIQIGD